MKLFNRKKKTTARVIPILVSRENGMDQRTTVTLEDGEGIYIKAFKDERALTELSLKEGEVHIVMEVGVLHSPLDTLIGLEGI